MRTTILVIIGAISFFGCSVQFAARDADMYRKDTRALLATKNGDIKQCYDAQIKNDVKPGGVVVVNFTVQEETGQIINAKLDKQRTTAPDTLSDCVVNAISGLALDPPDKRQGVATFVWEFAVKT